MFTIWRKYDEKHLIIFIAIALVLCLAATLFVACDKGNQGGGNQNGANAEAPNDTPIVADKTVSETKVTLYDGPKLLQTSSAMSVKIEGRDAFVYDTRVNHLRSFTYTAPKTYNQVVVFDFEGKLTLK